MKSKRIQKLDAYLYNFGEEYVKESKKKTYSAIDALKSYQALRKYFEDLDNKPVYQIRKRVLL